MTDRVAGLVEPPDWLNRRADLPNRMTTEIDSFRP